MGFGILRRRARIEYDLGSPKAEPARLVRWGAQPVGQGQSRLWTPATLHPQRNFDPTNILFWGRRGTGKTLTLVGFCKVFHEAFKSAWGKLPPSRRQRVASNFYMRFAQNAGPLGYDYGLIDDPRNPGELKPGRIPVDPCSQDMHERIVDYPPWASWRLFAFDELADVVNVMQFGSRLVRDWGSVLRQQRSLHSELITATQWPDQVARTTVMRQIDLLVLVKPHKMTYSADLLYFDVHGQFTGNYGRHRFLPPLEHMADWEGGISGLNHVQREYNTFEVIPPSWAKQTSRRAITERQYKGRDTYAVPELDPDAAELPDLPGEPQELPARRGRKRSVDEEDSPALNNLSRFKGAFTLDQARSALRDTEVPQATRIHRGALQGWLEANGFQVFEDPQTGKVMVRR